tara:strand:+ start:175 stop:594 length:420 start_codon:yes stop_codon:yes gene_type:complete
MPKSKKYISNKKKKKSRTKKNRKKPKINTNLSTIYKDHEFGGKYPVISFDRYVAQRRVDNFNLPSDFSSKSNIKQLVLKEFIRRFIAYLKFKKNQKLLYKTLKIKYSKNNIEAKLFQYSKKITNLKKLEQLYKTILSSK